MPQPIALAHVGNVFYFVKDFDAAVAWYTARLGRAPVAKAEQLVAFDFNGVRLTIHKQDELNAPGPAGVAAYWNVDDVDAIVTEWTKFGAKAHRGPKTVFTGERLCQILDPFGNLFAIRQVPPTPAVHTGSLGKLGDTVQAMGDAAVLPVLAVEDRFKLAELVTTADNCATHRDAEAYVSLFTDYGIMDGTQGDFCGQEAIRDAVLRVWQSEPQGTVHLTTNISISPYKDPNTAVVSSTLLTVVQHPPQLLAMTPIRQDVRLVDRRWRISRRTIGSVASA